MVSALHGKVDTESTLFASGNVTLSFTKTRRVSVAALLGEGTEDGVMLCLGLSDVSRVLAA